MTLRQQVERLIGEWDGSGATDRSQKREQLVSELIALVQTEATRHAVSPGRGATAQSARRASAA